jgi:ABC-type transport system involved in cytochrome bd biosynthesis fused ATPase/permease subunit
LVAVCAGVPAGHSLVVNLGAALLLGMGLSKIATGLSDAVTARDAYRRLRVLKAARLPSLPIENDQASLLMSVRDVTYQFPTGEGLRDPVTIEVDDGHTVLISGASGAGKSTLAELLSGRRRPHSGMVRVGRDVRIARVPQAGHEYMFHASLLFNVMCGSEWPPTEEGTRRAAALLAELGLDVAIEQMPNGIAQPVGEGGWRLSTGEAARVGLARALTAHPTYSSWTRRRRPSIPCRGRRRWQRPEDTPVPSL